MNRRHARQITGQMKEREIPSKGLHRRSTLCSPTTVPPKSNYTDPGARGISGAIPGPIPPTKGPRCASWHTYPTLHAFGRRDLDRPQAHHTATYDNLNTYLHKTSLFATGISYHRPFIFQSILTSEHGLSSNRTRTRPPHLHHSLPDHCWTRKRSPPSRQSPQGVDIFEAIL